MLKNHCLYSFFFGLGFFAVLPLHAWAAVSFSEIMYDPVGSDAKHEWVEIYTDAPVNISGWKFFEADVNHQIKAIQGTTTLSANSFSVIAADPTQFLKDYTHFSGTLFDSSFSLSNTGETLALKDSSGAVTASVEYASTRGAAGDGNSLGWSGSEFVPETPTPGSAFVKAPTPKVVPQPAAPVAAVVEQPANTMPVALVVEKPDSDNVTSTPGAAVVGTSAQKTASGSFSSMWYWIGAGVLILVLAGTASYLAKMGEKQNAKGTDTQQNAEDFELIDLDTKE